MGFIEETGAAQFYRDARILAIYEGTTAIQANDLVGRKTLRDGGAVARWLLDQVRQTEEALLARNDPAATRVAGPLRRPARRWPAPWTTCWPTRPARPTPCSPRPCPT